MNLWKHNKLIFLVNLRISVQLTYWVDNWVQRAVMNKNKEQSSCDDNVFTQRAASSKKYLSLSEGSLKEPRENLEF